MRLLPLLAALLCATPFASAATSPDLTLTSASFEVAIVGQPFSYAIIATPASATAFAASGLPAGLSCDAATGLVSGTPSAAGSSLVAITASDAQGAVSKVLHIDVNAPGALVIANPGTLRAAAGAAFSYQVACSGGPTWFAAVGLPAGIAISSTTGFISGTPSLGGLYPVSLIAGNAGGSWTVSLTFSVSPTVPAIGARVVTATVGDPVRLDIGGSNLPTAYAASALPPGLALDPVSGIITGTPSAAGTTAATITASNSGGTGSAAWTLIVNPAGLGSITASLSDAVIGNAYSGQVSASGAPTAFAASGLPPGLGIDAASGTVSGTPAAGSAGSYVVVVSAAYAGGTVSNAITLKVTPDLPVITTPATALAPFNAPFSDGVIATNAPTGFGASGLPAGLAIDPATGIISGSATRAGTFAATVSATNAGGTATAALTIIVPSLPAVTAGATAGAPVFAGPPSVTGFVGVPFALSILASGAPTSFGATGLPAGLAIDTVHGTISGTPTAAGASVAQLSCGNVTGSASTTLTVFIYAVPQPGITSSTARLSATVGAAFSYRIVATEGATAFTATGLPPGLSVDAATGIISGTPSAGGAYQVRIGAANASGTVDAILTIDVLPHAPVFSLATSLVAHVGAASSFALQNDDATATSYTASGLPAGLTVNAANGTISGTPTVTGVASISVSGTSPSGTTTVASTLIVDPAGTSTITSSLARITVAVGATLSYTITSSAAPATFAASGLPAGVSVDATSGVVSGAPTAGGTFLVLISASSGGVTWTEPLTIAVTPTPPVITTATLGVVKVGSAFFAAIAASGSPTSYAAAGLPPGIALDPVHGVLSGVPTTPGTSSVTLTASNAGGVGSATVPLVVDPPGQPSITSPSTVYVLPGVPFSYQVTAQDAPTAFAASGLPAGVGIDAGTGMISGTVAAVGTTPVVVSATNAAGERSALLSIVAVPSGSPGAPAALGSSGGGSHCGLGNGFAALALLALLALRMMMVPRSHHRSA